MNLNNGDKAKFLGCEIIYREACLLAARSRLLVDVAFGPKGLHDLPTADMLSRLQQSVDDIDDTGYAAILLGYARCNDGLVGLQARSIPLIMPKAHDCITFFFGSRRAYRDYFDAHPGTYFHTTGWIERDDPSVPGQPGVMEQLGLTDSFEQLVAKYGHDNAMFIRESLGDWKSSYSRLCYLQMGVTHEDAYLDQSRKMAAENHWTFEQREGDLSLLQRLFNGPWDDDFLIVRPGQKIVASNDDDVVAVEP